MAISKIDSSSINSGGPSWDGSGNLSFNSGYGSDAVAYGCRAWVNFNGTGTVAIRASGNVSSITDNGTGDYTVNFTAAMPDVNYSISGTASGATYPIYSVCPLGSGTAYAGLSVCRIGVGYTNLGTNFLFADSGSVSVAIFR